MPPADVDAARKGEGAEELGGGLVGLEPGALRLRDRCAAVQGVPGREAARDAGVAVRARIPRLLRTPARGQGDELRIAPLVGRRALRRHRRFLRTRGSAGLLKAVARVHLCWAGEGQDLRSCSDARGDDVARQRVRVGKLCAAAVAQLGAMLLQPLLSVRASGSGDFVARHTRPIRILGDAHEPTSIVEDVDAASISRVLAALHRLADQVAELGRDKEPVLDPDALLGDGAPAVPTCEGGQEHVEGALVRESCVRGR